MINLYQRLIDINSGMNDDSNSDSISLNDSFDYFDADYDIGYEAEEYFDEEYMVEIDYNNLSDTSTMQNGEEESSSESVIDSNSDIEFIPNESQPTDEAVAAPIVGPAEREAISEPIFIQRTSLVPYAQDSTIIEENISQCKYINY